MSQHRACGYGGYAKLRTRKHSFTPNVCSQRPWQYALTANENFRADAENGFTEVEPAN